MPRLEFLDQLSRLSATPGLPGGWSAAFDRHLQNCDA
jgi:hypothetical protein